MSLRLIWSSLTNLQVSQCRTACPAHREPQGDSSHSLANREKDKTNKVSANLQLICYLLRLSFTHCFFPFSLKHHLHLRTLTIIIDTFFFDFQNMASRATPQGLTCKSISVWQCSLPPSPSSLP